MNFNFEIKTLSKHNSKRFQNVKNFIDFIIRNMHIKDYKYF